MVRSYLKYLLPMLLLLGIIFLGVSWLSQRHNYENDIIRAEKILESRKNTVVNLFAPLVTSTAYFSKSKLLELNWETPLGRKALLEEMLLFAETHVYFEQVRIIGQDGRELLRVNEYEGEGQIVADAALQFKGDRDYFSQARDLKENEIYISPLNLNLEFGEVEIPYRAVMRVVRAVSRRDSIEGRAYFVTNISVENLFQAFMASGGEDNLTLVNNYGGAVSITDHGFSYHFSEVPATALFKDSLPGVWEELKLKDKGRVAVQNGVYVFRRTKLPDELHKRKSLARYDFLHAEDFDLSLVKFVPETDWPGFRGLSSEAKGFLLILLLLVIILSAILGHRDAREQNMFSKIAELNDALIKSQYELNTDRERLEDLVVKLSRRNMQLKEFSHIISHNIRSPIAGLAVLVAYMRDHGEVFSEKEIGELTAKLEYSTQVLTKLSDHLLETVRVLEHDQVPTRTLKLRDSIDKARNILIDQIIKISPKLHIDLEAWDELEFHKAYLDSIILNLMSNALDFRAQGRSLEIEIKTAWEDGRQVLYFKDNGRGINLDWHKDSVFGMYKTFHSDKAGEGLGLFMTRTQLEAMGAKIRVESREGEGSTFIITF